jgi:predicted negative regulator of RcsB-dependent stress response
MKKRFVSAIAVLICCVIIAIVGIFGYSRYKAQQVENAAFRAQLQQGAQDQQSLLSTHMPEQLPPRANSADGAASP